MGRIGAYPTKKPVSEKAGHTDVRQFEYMIQKASVHELKILLSEIEDRPCLSCVFIGTCLWAKFYRENGCGLHLMSMVDSYVYGLLIGEIMRRDASG